MTTAADLAAPLRAAIVGAAAVTNELDAYLGGYPVFTRRPAPADAPYPLVLVSPDIVVDDNDGLTDYRPVVTRDVAVYGQNDTAAHYRAVERVGYALRDLFHNNRQAITVSGWSVVRITAMGPIAAPVDDEQTVGRLVSLSIQLARKA